MRTPHKELTHLTPRQQDQIWSLDDEIDDILLYLRTVMKQASSDASSFGALEDAAEALESESRKLRVVLQRWWKIYDQPGSVGHGRRR